jgi:hypothetical protein
MRLQYSHVASALHDPGLCRSFTGILTIYFHPLARPAQTGLAIGNMFITAG